MEIFRFFQDVGCPPSWICYVCVRTTHKGHLVVFIAVQNLVGINAVALIICMFFDFASSAGKRLFTPPKLGFWGFDPLNGEQYQRDDQKAHSWVERRHMTYRSSKSVHRCDLCAWRRDQKKKERQRQKPNSGKWVFAETTHVGGSKQNFAWCVALRW